MSPAEKSPAAPFAGFPPRSPGIPIPAPFFTALLPQIEDVAELKVCLYLFWLRTQQPPGQPGRFATHAELAAAPGLGVEPALGQALERAVARGALLTLALEQDGTQQRLYFINDEEGRRTVDRISRGEIPLGTLPAPSPPSSPPTNIFVLYEQNIGLLTPLIAEELTEAEGRYPAHWIQEAFREAVSLNRRSWRYISRILERWALEGKDHGEAERHSEAGRPARPAKGRHSHPVWG